MGSRPMRRLLSLLAPAALAAAGLAATARPVCACSESPAGRSFARVTNEGVVYVPLPRERFVVVVEGSSVRQVPVRLGMYADVSPDGRWLATWRGDYSDEMLGAGCLATGGWLEVYDLRRSRPTARRARPVWARSHGMRAHRLRFAEDGRSLRMTYHRYDGEGDEATHHDWYRVRRGRPARVAPDADPTLAAHPMFSPAPGPADGTEVSWGAHGMVPRLRGDVVEVAGPAGALRLPARDLEDLEFSPHGRSLVALYAAFDEEAYNGGYLSRGFVVVRVDTGAVLAAWGTHPPLGETGRIPLHCTTRVQDPAPPLRVRRVPGHEAAVVARLANGAAVTVRERRRGWVRLEAPAGWVYGTMLRETCAPIR